MSFNLTPDGAFYWALGSGKAVPRPYNMRWLAPSLLRNSEKAWAIANIVSMLTFFMLIGIYCLQKHDPFPSVSAALWCAAPAVLCIMGPAVWFWRRYPVTVDVFGMVFALGAAVSAPFLPGLALLLLLIGACTNEKVPIFAAIYAGEPLFLFALAIPAFTYFFAPVGPIPDMFKNETREEMERVLSKPLRIFKDYHLDTLSNAVKWVLPWGGLLLALNALSTPLVLCLAVAYAQTLVATDSVRLYAWATPMMCAAIAPELVPIAFVISYILLPHTQREV